MTYSEFSDQFDVLYNNIMSNQAPGLDEYEKSVFLTKAQEELVLAYFNPKSNKVFEGFDGSERRQIDFSMLMRTVTPDVASSATDIQGGIAANAKYYKMPSDILLYVNEALKVTREQKSTRLTVVPINYIEYNRLMSKPFKRPLKNQAWRLITSGTGASYTYTDYAAIAAVAANNDDMEADFSTIYTAINGKSLEVQGYYLRADGEYLTNEGTLSNAETDAATFTQTEITNISANINKTVPASSTVVEIIPGPNDIVGSSAYIVRYVARPTPIITSALEGVTIEGKNTAMTSQLDPILHQEILQRAVELAKAAYTGDLSSQIALGTNSATEKGMLTQSNR